MGFCTLSGEVILSKFYPDQTAQLSRPIQFYAIHARLCVCVCVRACVRACVRVCVCVCLRWNWSFSEIVLAGFILHLSDLSNRPITSVSCSHLRGFSADVVWQDAVKPFDHISLFLLVDIPPCHLSVQGVLIRCPRKYVTIGLYEKTCPL